MPGFRILRSFQALGSEPTNLAAPVATPSRRSVTSRNTSTGFPKVENLVQQLTMLRRDTDRMFNIILAGQFADHRRQLDDFRPGAKHYQNPPGFHSLDLFVIILLPFFHQVFVIQDPGHLDHNSRRIREGGKVRNLVWR